MSGLYFQFICKHPIKVMLVSLAVLIATAAGIPQLSFKSDLRIYFSPENPQIRSLDHMQDTYTKVDNVLFVVETQNGVFNQEVLTLIEDLTSEAWKIPFSSRVDSITNFKHSYAKDDDIIVDNLVLNSKSLNAEQMDSIRSTALNEPLLLNRTISDNGKVTGVNVTINIPKGKELSSVPIVVKHVRGIAAKIRKQYPDIQLYLSGIVMMDNAFAEASEHDMKTLVPAMLILALLIMGWIMRSASASVASLLVLTFSIVAAMGLAGWFGIQLNPVSINAPNIILTIAICDCVHLLSGYLLGLRNGNNKQMSMESGLQKNIKPILITSITTAIGFLSLNTSEAPPFRDLGNITALGVIAALFFTLTFLPAFMMLLKDRVQPTDNSRIQTWIDGLAIKITHHPVGFAVGSTTLAATISLGLLSNVLNDEFVKYFDEDIQFRQHTDYTAEHLTGIYYIDYAIAGKTDSGINNPSYLHTLDDFTQWLRQQNEVKHVNSITDILKRLNHNMHADQPQYYRLPDSQALAAQYLLMYEMSLPYGLDLRDRINADKSASRVTATLNNLSSEEVLAFEARAQQWLEQHNEHIQFSGGTGLTIMFANIGMRNINSMLTGTAIALVIISLMLMYLFRSIRYGFLSLIPNVLPALMAFGLWGILVGQIGMALSVVAAMTLGIVVDDTVHILNSYLHGRRTLALNAKMAVQYTFSQVGKALLTTSLALTAGFAMLAFSSFAINAGMGLLTALVITLALVLDFTLLPALLILIDRKKQPVANENTHLSPQAEVLSHKPFSQPATATLLPTPTTEGAITSN